MRSTPQAHGCRDDAAAALVLMVRGHAETVGPQGRASGAARFGVGIEVCRCGAGIGLGSVVRPRVRI